MNHDITHCDNTNCAERFRCQRYLAHIDKINRGLKGHYPYLVHESRKTKCEGYLPITH